MKYLFALAALVGSAFAQSAFIEAPAPGTDVTPGSNVTVTVWKPDSLTGSTDIAIVLSLQSCVGIAPAGTCDGFDASQDLGTILHYGPFDPEVEPPISLGFHENYTVTIPSSTPKGAAALLLTHLVLVGLGPYPLLDISNITLNVV
ncbi:hypothetical protein NM688_g4678 [Phlebia brevispora]|uniref:Uncharacterized protein n=1 Tax=Phlebia brevispora TaxID=194682 RepID=A0ACC1T2K0_9APHY|nr:hypothetical protein NM688_g4678 [Phlebia brevispora]